ncbi:MAG: hypothetical protein ACRDLN_07640 [Solirubrobacteraceae bacterium]
MAAARGGAGLSDVHPAAATGLALAAEAYERGALLDAAAALAGTGVVTLRYAVELQLATRR